MCQSGYKCQRCINSRMQIENSWKSSVTPGMVHEAFVPYCSIKKEYRYANAERCPDFKSGGDGDV
jgi:hypothetical protein